MRGGLDCRKEAGKDSVPTDTASLGFPSTVTTVKAVHQQSHRDRGTEKGAGIGAALGGEAWTVQLKAALTLTLTLTLSNTQGQVGACVPPRPGPHAEPRNTTSERRLKRPSGNLILETEPAAPSGSR